MKISFNTSTIEPMFNWLMDAKENNNRDEQLLRKILQQPDYLIEFERYGIVNLPVCNINVEDAVDFFMNFDKKKFSNQRLSYKQESFTKFYNNLEKNMELIKMFNSINKDDMKIINNLLANALPNELVEDDTLNYNIILIISIGNSMGWPYKNFIDFDVANLALIENKMSFLHIIAHEIHHTMFGSLIAEDFKPEEFFLMNFAFEGLAVHYCNNASTIDKPKKYSNDITYCMVEPDWTMYQKEHQHLVEQMMNDYKECQGFNSMEEVQMLLARKYEKFTYYSVSAQKEVNIGQYPTYYLGCYFWGTIDLMLGKEKVFECLKNPSTILPTFEEARMLMEKTK